MFNLIPTFPDKTNLALPHKLILDQISHKYKYRYATSSFTNLFILDLNNTTTLSRIHENIFISRQEPAGEVNQYLIGKNRQNQTLSLLKQNRVREIEYYHQVKSARFDRDNAEYLYDVKQLTRLEGSEYTMVRRKIKGLQRKTRLKHEHIRTRGEQKEIWQFTQKCNLKIGQKNPEQRTPLREESYALEKALQFNQQLDLQLDIIKNKKDVIGFSITEKILADTLLIHFFKTDHNFRGLAEYFFWYLAKTYQTDCHWINFEQDLGIPGLRQFKKSLQPAQLLPVYSIKLN